MSRENVELVRLIYAVWERGDFTLAEWADPEIEYVHADGPDAGSWKGPAEMARRFRTRLSAWEGFRLEADEYRELEPDRVLVLDRLSGRGKTSGLDLERIQSRGAWLFHVRDGRVTRMVRYNDRDRALEAVGLRE